jgi:predicted transposase YbfD/YdcC
VKSLAKPFDGEVVAFDGKTIRGALRRTPWGKTFHTVHVWCTKQKLLLAQRATDAAPGEHAAIEELLKAVTLKGAIVTIDAAHCSPNTAQKILVAEAQYVLHLKANCSATFQLVEGFFHNAPAQSFEGIEVRHQRTAEKGHGREEMREAWSVPAKALPSLAETWPGLKSVTWIERTRVVKGVRSVEQHYFLASLPVGVRRIEAAARTHWEVENGLHWSLDVQLGEDACAIHDENGAQNFGVLRRITQMLLKRETTCQRGLAAKAAKASRNTSYLERVLSCGIP